MLDKPEAKPETVGGERTKPAEPQQEGPKRLKEVVITLGTPIEWGDETVKTLTFRRPTGGDIMAMTGGYPIIIDWQSGAIVPNPPVMGAMMAILSSQPPSLIKKMDAEDWSTCAHSLMGFFPPGAQVMQY